MEVGWWGGGLPAPLLGLGSSGVGGDPALKGGAKGLRPVGAGEGLVR